MACDFCKARLESATPHICDAMIEAGKAPGIVVRIDYSGDYYHDGYSLVSQRLTIPCCASRETIEQALALLGVTEPTFADARAREAWEKRW